MNRNWSQRIDILLFFELKAGDSFQREFDSTRDQLISLESVLTFKKIWRKLLIHLFWLNNAEASQIANRYLQQVRYHINDCYLKALWIYFQNYDSKANIDDRWLSV